MPLARPCRGESSSARASELQALIVVLAHARTGGLLESELFGHERGAFTGAVSQTVGRCQAADRGTLFPGRSRRPASGASAQAASGACRNSKLNDIGSGGRLTSVDVRVIAATNQDHEEMVRRRTFRADRFYRLNVFPIRVPPLRERTEDHPLLVAHFVRRFAERQSKSIDEIPDAVIDTLRHHAWPGNVRELQNVIERASDTGRGCRHVARVLLDAC